MEVLGGKLQAGGRAHAGKVLALQRIDAPEGGKGKPCGESYIPKVHECSKNRQSRSTEGANLTKWAALGISAAAVGGIAAVLYSQAQTKKKILSQLKTAQVDARTRRKAEHDAIYNYVSASYGLNRALRDNTELDERYSTIKEGLDSWLRDKPGSDGVYYRGIPWNAITDWSNVEKGAVITDRAFGSFTSSRQMGQRYGTGSEARSGVVIVARGKATQLPYHIKNQYGAGFEASLRREREYLTPRNTQFQVIRIQEVSRRFSRKPGWDELVPDSQGDIVRKQRVVYVNIVSR